MEPGEMKKYVQNTQSQNLYGRNHFGDFGLDGRIILKLRSIKIDRI
jgi:hypothetical protein